MTMLVVDLLEMVDVDHQHRQLPVVSLRPGKLSFQGLEELPSVRELRQVIQSGEFAQLLCGVNEARNVVKRHQTTALWQGFALELQDATVAQAKPAFALADVILNGARRCEVNARSASVIDYVRKVVSRAIRRHRQIPYSMEGAVNEPRSKLLVQHDESVVNFIKCRHQDGGRSRHLPPASPVNRAKYQRGNVSVVWVVECRSDCSRRSSLRAVPWTRSPKSTSSISMIRPLRRPTALMACTRNLPSQMNHDTIV